MLRDLALLALKNIMARKARSALTLIGIAIGMTAVVALISLSVGAQRAIERQFAKLGADVILVVPAGGLGEPRPAQLDLAILKSIPGVRSVGAVRREILSVKSAATPGFLAVVGVRSFDDDARLFGGLELAQGRLFLPDRDEVVLGEGAARDFRVALGESITIQDRAFHVVGILQRTGNDQDDYALYLAFEKLEELVDAKGLISLALVRAAPEQDPTALAHEIQRVLRESVTEHEFVVQSSKQLSDLVSGVLTVLRWTLGAIAGISLIVGGIGLANTMLMAIVERTHEIGILKALGARRDHILVLFLVESGVLGLLGGLAGLLVGGAIAHSVAVAAHQFLRTDLFSVAFDGALIFGALSFSVLLGMLAGVWPAWRAARLDPVEALRYE
ncbi:Macrolide export ATP-binding/permease protein MacB [bacterium HR07]|uniref:ABC transporter system permease protein n=2 Tax=Candidatus Bipolaricaulota TaxID=67810 RepID=H5S8A6_9BACT|nr:ABC transporter system permease protein [uncultured Acetothermia bacterium]BAL60065.1 ABC transporter system permease protein [Candidatus Acetothermum autotrophicum]GBC75857.1 Macrolide export ATP-binding/permease protein MacB [bacterium HR07]